MKRPDFLDTAIIGGGPAGISAGIYLKNAGFEPLIFERGRIGGLVLNANCVENYPGLPEGIRGEDLAAHFADQLKRSGVKVLFTEVSKVILERGLFKVIAETDEFKAKTVIAATGTIPANVHIPGMKELLGKRAFYEIKDLPAKRRGKRFAIIGSGDAAFDYALNLLREECRVDILMRSAEPKCTPGLRSKAARKKRLRIFGRTEPKRIIEKNGALVIECRSMGKARSFDANYVLVACGRTAEKGLFSSELERRMASEGPHGGVPGLFLAGDVRRGEFRQVGIAVGDGIFAAMSAAAYLTGGECR